MYKKINDAFVQRVNDGAFVPVVTTEYLAWLAEGNVPEPADPIPEPTPVDPVAKLQAFLAANPDVQALL